MGLREPDEIQAAVDELVIREIEPPQFDGESADGERLPDLSGLLPTVSVELLKREFVRSSTGLLGMSAVYSVLVHALAATIVWRTWGLAKVPHANRRPQVEIESGVAAVDSQRSVARISTEPMPSENPDREQPDRELRPTPIAVRRRAESVPAPPPPPEFVVTLSRPSIESLLSKRLPEEIDTLPEEAVAMPPRSSQKSVELSASAAVESVASVRSTGSQAEFPPKSLPTNPAPAYPAEAWSKRIEGLVELRVLVGIDGRVRDVVLHRSSGSDALDLAALQTVRDQWRFEPARDETGQIEIAVVLPIRFQIRTRN